MELRQGTWAAVFVLASAGGGDELRLAPVEDARLVRAWSEELRLELDALEMTLAGNEIAASFESVEFVERRAFELTDEIAAAAEGRLTQFERAYDAGELAFELEVDGTPRASASGAHACAGCRVRFEYDAEKDEYVRERIEGTLGAEQLEGLGVALDLAGLLPATEVEEGATWQVDPELLREFFAAGGELGFAPAVLSADDLGVPSEVVLAGTLGSPHELFLPESEIAGEVEAKYDGAEEGLARLVFTLELTVVAALDEKYSSFALDGGDTSGRTLDVAAELEGELVVLWDSTANHLRSAQFRGELALDSELAFPFRMQPDADPLDFEGSYELSGEVEVGLAVR